MTGLFSVSFGWYKFYNSYKKKLVVFDNIIGKCEVVDVIVVDRRDAEPC